MFPPQLQGNGSMAKAHASRSLDGKTLRFHFDDGPMKGKEFDHTFRGDKVDWGAAGSDKKTTSEGKLGGSERIATSARTWGQTATR
jgi:hypothetical protein